MESSHKNPPSNKLRPGITEEQLADAISKSGYPLQTIIASRLRSMFDLVSEEWSFIDRDSGALRTLDVMASKRLYDWGGVNDRRVRPEIDLLVECKQSDLPYVFFLSSATPSVREFPIIGGLFYDRVTVATDDDISTSSLSINESLSLAEHGFIVGGPNTAFSFSKCVRKGPKIELSGTEAFHGIVLPLISALQHLKKQEQPPTTAHYHDLHIALAVAVIDGSMVGVQVDEAGHKLSSMPWVRVIRQEARESKDWTERSHAYVVDVVHKDFFEEYVTDHVLPFAKELADKALKHDVELATGKGFAKGMGKTWALDVEPKLTPLPATRRIQRTISITGRILLFLSSLGLLPRRD